MEIRLHTAELFFSPLKGFSILSLGRGCQKISVKLIYRTLARENDYNTFEEAFRGSRASSESHPDRVYQGDGGELEC